MISSISRLIIDFEKYETGFKQIDQDHLEILFNLLRIKELNNPIYEIQTITCLLHQHFQFEESLMIDLKYPMYDLHKAVHTEYLIKFQEALRIGSDITISTLLADTVNHFIWHDKLLVDWMFENGFANYDKKESESTIS